MIKLYKSDIEKVSGGRIGYSVTTLEGKQPVYVGHIFDNETEEYVISTPFFEDKREAEEYADKLDKRYHRRKKEGCPDILWGEIKTYLVEIEDDERFYELVLRII